MKQVKIFILALVIFLITPLVFGLQTGFLEAKVICLNGDCRVVWPSGEVTGIFAGGNIDVNANTGDVLVSFDDGNFISISHLWTEDQNIEKAFNPTWRTIDTTNGVRSVLQSQDNFGIIGTETNHDFLIATNSILAITVASNQSVRFASDVNIFNGRLNVADLNALNNVSGIIAGGNIDVNSLTGHVRIDFDDGNFLGFANTFTKHQQISSTNEWRFNSTSNRIFGSLGSRLNLDASSRIQFEIGGNNQVLIQDGVLGFESGGEDPRLDFSVDGALTFDIALIEKMRVTNSGVIFFEDLNNFQGQANIFDANITNPSSNGVAYPFSDLNSNAQTTCSGDSNSVLTSVGLCQSIQDFDATGGGAGTDTNIFAGSNIDVNQNTAGHVLVSFDDANFHSSVHPQWSADQGHTDNTKDCYGGADDGCLFYDGTNLIIDPAEAGSGFLSTNGAGFRANSIGLAGSNPSSSSMISGSSNGPDFSIGANVSLIHTGSAAGIRGMVFSPTFAGTANSPNVRGLNTNARINANPSSVANIFGVLATAGLTEGLVQSDIAHTYYGVYGEIAANNTDMNGGQWNVYSIFGAPISAMDGTGNFTFNGWSGYFDGNVQLSSQGRLILEGTTTSMGDSYIFYDDDNGEDFNTMNFVLEGNEKFNLNQGGLEIIEDLNVVSDANGFFDSFTAGINSTSISVDTNYDYAGGVTMGGNRMGYVAVCDGSIISLGAVLEIQVSFAGTWETEVLVNGLSVLTVAQDASSLGTEIDFIKQNRGVDNFSPGDIISVFLNETGGASTVGPATANVRIQYDC